MKKKFPKEKTWLPFRVEPDKKIFNRDTKRLDALWPRVKNNLYEILITAMDLKGNWVSTLAAQNVSRESWKRDSARAGEAGYEIDPRWGMQDDSCVIVQIPTYVPAGVSCISQCADDSAIGKLDPFTKRKIGDGETLWLSIKRYDQGLMGDWRVFQRIKNEVCGLEMEAVQLNPAMSRIVDSANQFHLFVRPNFKEIGWHETYVCDAHEATAVGAKQRPLPQWMRPFETPDKGADYKLCLERHLDQELNPARNEKEKT